MGKIIGFLIGLSIGGIYGALIGLFLGHLLDRGRSGRVYRNFDPRQRAQVEETFFNTMFSLAGHLAKADGRISENEISDTEALMSRMKLRAEDRQRAITRFKEGAAPGFDPNATLAEFERECGRYANLKQMLLAYLISLALADGGIDEAEKAVLQKIAASLGYTAATFNQILRMAIAQSRFYGYQHGTDQDRGPAGPAQAERLDSAYEALGVESAASDAEVKRAYRRLMSQYHPDKVTGRGMPDDMVELATERAQEIQAAYDTIKKHRGIS